jgi:hypothetical protein
MLLASFRGMNSDGGMNAQAAYDKMVAQFGERAVLDAATKASQLKRGPCGSSDKAVCVSYKWHMDDPPTKPHPQHYAGESDGTIYIARMLLLNPEMHTEKDVIYTKLHVTVPNAVGTYGVVHLTRTVTDMLRTDTRDPVSERRASPSRRYDQVSAQTRIGFSVE